MMAKYVTYDPINQMEIQYENKEIVDADTGEIVPVCEVTKKIYGTGKHFHKVWLESFLESFSIAQCKQVDVMCYIYEHTSMSNNVFLGTYKSIAEAVGVSQPTIATIMKKMQEKNIIRKIQNGAWQINPAIIMQGSNNKQKMLITKFENLEGGAPRLE